MRGEGVSTILHHQWLYLYHCAKSHTSDTHPSSYIILEFGLKKLVHRTNHSLERTEANHF